MNQGLPIAAVPPPPSAPVSADDIEHFCTAAEHAWPHLQLSRERFVVDLHEKLAGGEPGRAGLQRLCPGELYLAAACRHGDPAALQAFEDRYLQNTRTALHRLGLSEDQIREVHQLVRVKLLLPQDSGRPRIWDYAGSGKLEALVRVVALRTGVSQRRAEARFDQEAELLELPMGGSDPDLLAIKRESQEKFKDALDFALATLSPRERNVLRLSIIDGLRVDQIAALYQVHRVTMSRFLSAARATLADKLRRRLRAVLRLSERDLDSFLSVLDSQLELSLDRLLQTHGGLRRAANDPP